MPISSRNVDVAPSGDAADWPYEALVTVMERGLVQDWQPLIAAIRGEPWGTVARRVEHYLSYADDAPIASLFRLILDSSRNLRAREERAAVASRVRDAMAESRLTRAEFAAAIGTSASRLSTYATGRVVPSAAMLIRIEREAVRRSRAGG